MAWGNWPRLKVWTKEEILEAGEEDEALKGDFGNVGVSVSKLHSFLM